MERAEQNKKKKQLTAALKLAKRRQKGRALKPLMEELKMARAEQNKKKKELTAALKLAQRKKKRFVGKACALSEADFPKRMPKLCEGKNGLCFRIPTSQRAKFCKTGNNLAVSLDILPTPSQVRNLMTPKAERQPCPSERDEAFGSRKRNSFYESLVCSRFDVLCPSICSLLSQPFSSRLLVVTFPFSCWGSSCSYSSHDMFLLH